MRVLDNRTQIQLSPAPTRFKQECDRCFPITKHQTPVSIYADIGALSFLKNAARSHKRMLHFTCYASNGLQSILA